MKALSITGLVLSILNFLAAMYLQFILAPAAASLAASLEASDYSDELLMDMEMMAHEAAVNLGMGLLLTAGLSFLICGFAAWKTKSKAAYIGLALSLVALFIACLHGTHMFS